MPLPGTGGAGSSGESPVSSLERNIKPSDILRQKSSENIESKYAANRKTTPELSKLAQTPELMEELGRKMVGKTDSLEHAKRNDGGGSCGAGTAANGGSLGRTSSTPGRTLTPAGGSGSGRTVGASPTGSLTKTAKLAAADSSSTSSLEKKSRVSLQASDAEASVTAAQRSAGSKESLASQGISEVVSTLRETAMEELY